MGVVDYRTAYGDADDIPAFGSIVCIGNCNLHKLTASVNGEDHAAAGFPDEPAERGYRILVIGGKGACVIDL